MNNSQSNDDPLLQPQPQTGRPAPLQVGQLWIQPEKFSAEGGFARVYFGRVLTTQQPVALKKIICQPDGQQSIQTEIRIMKSNQHKNIVGFLEAALGQRYANGNTEIYICMEYCPGSVIQLMNRRLPGRLTEEEALSIFWDVCEGLSVLHYQNPPIIHRDLKVENILISAQGQYKLCDFGSCSTLHLPPDCLLPTQKINLLLEDIEKNTTMAYRAPELIDLYKKRGISYKADIWALGCLLYKLLFFKTPFEDESGQANKLAILNGKWSVPERHPYKEEMIQLIGWLLKDHPKDRPNLFQLFERLSPLLRRPVPVPEFQQESQIQLQPDIVEEIKKQQQWKQEREQQLLKEQQLQAQMNQQAEQTLVPQRRGRVRNQPSQQSQQSQPLQPAPQQQQQSQSEQASFFDKVETSQPALETVPVTTTTNQQQQQQQSVDFFSMASASQDFQPVEKQAAVSLGLQLTGEKAGLHAVQQPAIQQQQQPLQEQQQQPGPPKSALHQDLVGLDIQNSAPMQRNQPPLSAPPVTSQNLLSFEDPKHLQLKQKIMSVPVSPQRMVPNQQNAVKPLPALPVSPVVKSLNGQVMQTNQKPKPKELFDDLSLFKQ